MDKVVDKNRLLESSRWREFFHSAAVGLQIGVTLLTDDGSCIMHTPMLCPNCNSAFTAFNPKDMDKISDIYKSSLTSGKFIACDGSIALLQKLKNGLSIVVRECSCMAENNCLDMEQRARSAQKLLHSFLSLLNEGIEGGERAVELLTLRQINHIVIAMFQGKDKTIEPALDLILSALIILLDAKGSFIEYKRDGKTHLLIKGDKKLMEEYMYEKVGHPVVEKIGNDIVHGSIGVLEPKDMDKVSSLLSSMAQECLITFEIDRLFRLMQTQLTRILGAIGSAVVMFDRNNEICYVNGAAEKLYGCNAADIMGKNAGNMYCPWSFAVLEEVEYHMSGTMDKLECCGEDKWIDWQVCPIWDGAEVSGRLVIADDRTDYHKWREIGRRAERLAAVESLIGPLAHQLRNPIAAAKGLVQLMGHKKDPQKIMGYNNLVLRELDRVTSLLNEFLMLGKPALIPSEPVDLNLFLEELMPILMGEVAGTSIEMTTDIQAVPPVLVDSGQLTQVILNIVRNSVEAVGSSGHINISLKSDGYWAEIAFKDSGPGLLDEIMDRIFEPFFTTKERGAGLGLPVAQAIVNNHGGYIKSSNSPAGGAVFSVKLPVINPEAETAYNLEVMLAAKDDITRSSMEQVLRTDGIHVVSVRDLSSAFSMQLYYCPQVIIIDESFINTSSVEFIRKVWPNINILAIGNIKEQPGMVGIQCISFPVEYSKFVDKVRSMILL